MAQAVKNAFNLRRFLKKERTLIGAGILTAVTFVAWQASRPPLKDFEISCALAGETITGVVQLTSAESFGRHMRYDMSKPAGVLRYGMQDDGSVTFKGHDGKLHTIADPRSRCQIIQPAPQ